MSRGAAGAARRAHGRRPADDVAPADRDRLDAVLLDLGEAHVGDATGFGLIVECQRRARRAGRPMRIVAADERTRRLLRRARLHSLLLAVPVADGEPALAGAAG